MPQQARVSIIIPTRNAARTLEACLRSARAQALSAEVVVVDNGSTDLTREIAGRLADVVLEAGPERSAQRNTGASKAGGDVLVFIDADMVLDPGVVAGIVRAFEQQIDALVLPELSFGEGFWAACKALEKRLYLGDAGVEAARAFRREVFERAGGYDETLTAGEDWDLHERVQQSSAVLGRIEPCVRHDEGKLTLAGTIRKKFGYGKTFARYTAKSTMWPRRVARVSLMHHPGTLARTPLVATGLFIMKVAEAAGFAAGLATASAMKGKAVKILGIDEYARDHPQLGFVAQKTSGLGSTVAAACSLGMPIVDVGCGEGQTLAVIRTDGAPVPVLGVERSPARAASAAARGFPVVVADGARLPLADGSTGAVVLRHVIEHVSDDAALLSEIARTLAPGGHLYLETPLRLPGAWYPYRNTMGDRVLDPTHVREYESIGEIEERVRAAGFRSATTSVVPIAYPAGHVLARVFKRLGANDRTTGWIAEKLRARIRVPRYREIRVDAIRELVR